MPNLNNKKTTIVGYLALVGAVIAVVSAYLSGESIGDAIQNGLMPALAGLGFIGASDGGH